MRDDGIGKMEIGIWEREVAILVMLGSLDDGIILDDRAIC